MRESMVENLDEKWIWCHAGDHPFTYVQDAGAISESNISGGVQGREWVYGG
jgi:hypothetical protein